MSDVIGTVKKQNPILVDSNPVGSIEEEELNGLWKVLKEDYQKYVQYKLIYKTILECTGDHSCLDPDLSRKIKKILLSQDCSQITLDLNSPSSNCTTYFANVDSDSAKLSYSERDKLNEALEVKFNQKLKAVSRLQLDIPKENGGLQFVSEDAALVDFKQKLTIEQELYIKNLLVQQDLLSQIADFRLKSLPKVSEEKVRECSILTKINQLKSEITHKKFRVDIFMENNSSLEAYRELIADIRKQQEDCVKDITRLQELNVKYEQVSCKQYDDILKSYIQYKSNIEKKKMLFDCMKA